MLRVPDGEFRLTIKKNNEEPIMKKFKIFSIAAALSFALLSSSGVTVAQDSDGAIRFGENSTPAVYVRVTFVCYKQGKAGEAYGIIADHFQPAGEAAGLPGPVAVHFQTGPYDAAFHWRLDNGMSDLEWQRSPRNVKFMAALAEQEGSMEAAQAVFDRYNALIARSVTSVGHRHVAEDEE
jgi:hypothetical protein